MYSKIGFNVMLIFSLNVNKKRKTLYMWVGTAFIIHIFSNSQTILIYYNNFLMNTYCIVAFWRWFNKDRNIGKKTNKVVVPVFTWPYPTIVFSKNYILSLKYTLRK